MTQTSMPPPPPTHSGGRAFIGVIIVMLLMMGGLLYWKFGKKDAPPPPAPIPSQTAAALPTFDEAPPPPPPAEPDAGKKEAPTKRHVVSSGGNGGCNAVCSGDAPAALRGALSGAAGSVRGCYERALRQNQMLQGRLVVAVKIGPHGQSCGASISTDTLGDPSVASCVLQKFRGGSFPPPIGGCADLQVPISFMPKTGK